MRAQSAGWKYVWTIIPGLAALLLLIAWLPESGSSLFASGIEGDAQQPPARTNATTVDPGPYEVVPDHFKPPFPSGWTWGTVAGVYVESPDRVYIYQRGILPTLPQFVGPD